MLSSCTSEKDVSYLRDFRVDMAMFQHGPQPNRRSFRSIHIPNVESSRIPGHSLSYYSYLNVESSRIPGLPFQRSSVILAYALRR